MPEVFTPFTMFNQINLRLLLLLCLVYHGGNAPKFEKGGNATLTCEFESRKYVKIELTSKSENIPVCQEKNCTGRVFKLEDCDIVIKDLKLNDSGIYILRAYYEDQKGIKHEEKTYHLHIHDNITVNAGEELKMHVLFSNADKVEKKSSGNWSEVWNTTHGSLSERINVTYGNLIINKFMAHDAGLYRVLDSEGNILITVTVTETSVESNKSGSEKEKEKENEQHKYLPNWTVIVIVIAVIAVIVGIVLIVGIAIKRKVCHRNHIQVPTHENPEPPAVLAGL